jgi:hypothetical protein
MSPVVEQYDVLATGDAMDASLDCLRWPVETVTRVALVEPRTGYSNVAVETWQVLSVNRLG